MNSELVPDLVKDIITKYQNAKKDVRGNYNEIVNLEMRLQAIQSAVTEALSGNLSMSMKLRK